MYLLLLPLENKYQIDSYLKRLSDQFLYKLYTTSGGLYHEVDVPGENIEPLIYGCE